MNNKLIILIGIQGSGKSTYARKLALSDPLNTVIVSRDSIRSGLGKYWVPQRERLVSEIEDSSIWHSLDLGYTVIVDATNFHHRNFERMAESYQIPCEIKYFDIPLWKAKLRVLLRFLKGGRWIDFKIITNFHNRYVKIRERG